MNKDLIVWLVWIVVIATVFAVLWRKGYLVRLRAYWLSTLEELKKCTWPSWDELKGSTVVVAISIALLGGFTVFADFVFNLMAQWLT